MCKVKGGEDSWVESSSCALLSMDCTCRCGCVREPHGLPYVACAPRREGWRRGSGGSRVTWPPPPQCRTNSHSAGLQPLLSLAVMITCSRLRLALPLASFSPSVMQA